MGWIHLRYPVGTTDTWEPPDQYFGWHLDGDPDRSINKKSVVVLPFITDVGPGGGGTAVLEGSHNIITGFMSNKTPEKGIKAFAKIYSRIWLAGHYIQLGTIFTIIELSKLLEKLVIL